MSAWLRCLILSCFLLGPGFALAANGEICEESAAPGLDTTKSMAENMACYAEFTAQGCEKIREELPEEERSLVRDCRKPEEPLSPALVAKACGSAVGSMAQGAVEAIQNIPQIPGAVLGVLAEAGRMEEACRNSRETRAEILRPVAMFYKEQDLKTLLETTDMGCSQFMSIRNLMVDQAWKEISEKTRLKATYGEMLTPERAALLEYTPEQKAFMEYQALINQGPTMQEMIEEVQRIAACYTTAAKAQFICEAALGVAARIGMIGAGAKIVALLKKRLDAKAPKLNSTMSPTERVQLAEQTLGRSLSTAQKDALEKAHQVGNGQLGRDGLTPASSGNYTNAQLREKAEILRDAGFTLDERRKILEHGIAGMPTVASELSASLVLGLRGTRPPQNWPDSKKAELENAIRQASGDHGSGRHTGTGTPRSVYEADKAVSERLGLQGRVLPEIIHEPGGKAVMVYKTGLSEIRVKLNVINGQYYMTVIERVNGQDRYLRFNSRGGLEACPSNQIASCHPPLAH